MADEQFVPVGNIYHKYQQQKKKDLSYIFAQTSKIKDLQWINYEITSTKQIF